MQRYTCPWLISKEISHGRTETEEGQVQENRYDAEGLRYEVRKNANRIRFVYHQDEQLSTAFITNEKREIQNHYQYDAFGNGICQEEGISNRIRYTGQQVEENYDKQKNIS